jgi:site-specific recombinase XerD
MNTDIIVKPLETSLNNKININEIMDYYFSYDEYRGETKRVYRVGVQKFSSWLKSNNITLVDEAVLLSYKKYLGSTYSVRTANLYLTSVRWLFKHLTSRGIPNLMLTIPNFKNRARFSKMPIPTNTYIEIIDTLEKERETLKQYRDYAIFRMAVGCMLREIEMSRCDKRDIHDINFVKVVDIQGKGRDTKDNFAVLHDDVYIAIQEYLKKRGHDEYEALFISLSNNQYGHRLTTRAIREVLSQILTRFKLESPLYSGHSTRHTGATILNESGMAQLQEIQEVLRHQNINTTTIYTHLQNRLEKPMEYILQEYIKLLKERSILNGTKQNHQPDGE